MRSLNVTRLGCGVVLFVGWAMIAAATQPEPTAADQKPQPADFDRLAEVFKMSGTPDLKGKSWASAAIKWRNGSFGVQGWLVEDRANNITIFDCAGRVHKARKPRKGEKPPSPEFPGSDDLVAWDLQITDFIARSAEMLKEGLKDSWPECYPPG